MLNEARRQSALKPVPAEGVRFEIKTAARGTRTVTGVVEAALPHGDPGWAFHNCAARVSPGRGGQCPELRCALRSGLY
jgi:hypothetical protein